jgi:hypothetical protein
MYSFNHGYEYGDEALAHLEITAQQQKIHLDPLLLFCFLDRRVDIVQTSVGTTFYGDLYFGDQAVRDLSYPVCVEDLS